MYRVCWLYWLGINALLSAQVLGLGPLQTRFGANFNSTLSLQSRVLQQQLQRVESAEVRHVTATVGMGNRRRSRQISNRIRSTAACRAEIAAGAVIEDVAKDEGSEHRVCFQEGFELIEEFFHVFSFSILGHIVTGGRSGREMIISAGIA